MRQSSPRMRVCGMRRVKSKSSKNDDYPKKVLGLHVRSDIFFLFSSKTRCVSASLPLLQNNRRNLLSILKMGSKKDKKICLNKHTNKKHETKTQRKKNTRNLSGKIKIKVTFFCEKKLVCIVLFWASGLGIGFWLRGVQPRTTTR